MRSCIFVVVVLWFVCIKSFAQVVPAEGSIVNYTMVGFSAPSLTGGVSYKFEIAKGNFNDVASFETNIILKLDSKANKVIGHLPDFGSQYTWRVTVQPQITKDALRHGTPLMHFSTGVMPNVDTNQMRLHVTTNDKSRKDAFIFLDFNKILYDMKGVPIWYLPIIDSIEYEKAVVRDMKLTNVGTITFLMNDEPYEIDYNGNVLWKGSNDGKISGDSLEYYHHEFTRLSNGHYMVLGSEKLLWEPKGPTTPNFLRDNKKALFGTVIEYDKMHNIVWSWRSSKYYRETFFNYDTPPGSQYDIHQNAFCYDERNKAVYVSFRNIDQIVKVKYPTGEVLNTYSNKLFCGQHNCSISPKGYLYLFNNNTCSDDPVPKITVLKEPVTKGGIPKKIWEFACPILATNVHKGMKPKITNGGSVTELSDNSFLASQCSPYSDIFIVNRAKKIVWYAVPEKWDVAGGRWFVLPQYRVSIIEHKKDLEKAIWYK